MEQEKPDFFLSTAGEYGPLAEPRACWEKASLRDARRDDYMEVAIDPSLAGQEFGLGASDVDTLLIASRLAGFTLYPIREWPVPVYIARILDNRVINSGHFENDQVELIAWGMLFRTQQEALSYAMKF